MENIREKCGIFGIYGKGVEAARLTYFGLFALQHRGQENSGIASSDGTKIRTHKGIGLVPQVYTEKHLEKLKGYIAIGHNRYATSGGTFSKHAQPVAGHNDIVALAHNGNLPQTKKLIKFLASKKISTRGMNDSELMHSAVKYYIHQGLSLKDAVSKAFPLFTGAFSLLVMTRDALAVVRDRNGIRPLSLGELNGGFVIASETCAIDTVNGTVLRDIMPGELVIINEKGLESVQLATADQKLDIFEFIYFSRPDSILLGKWVHDVRKNLGRELAKEYKIKADVVVPVPDSAIPAAIGYSEVSKIPFDFGLVKNRYIWRTFIMPNQKLRNKGVEMKLHVIRQVVEGKRVIIVDDSIVRGTTAKRLVRMVRNAGAKKVHILSSCPPIRFPDFYGIDTPSQHELIASQLTVKNVEKFIQADSVCYLSYDGMIRATDISENKFCTSQFNGYYPIDIGSHMNKITYAFKDKDDRKKLAVLISDKGTGSNLQAIIDAIENGKINAGIAVAISDSENAYGLVRAKKHNINTKIINRPEELLPFLKEGYPVDFICLAGWKQFLTDEFINEFKNKILNVHPGLIPNTMDGVVKNPDGTNALWNKKKFTEKAIQNFFDNGVTFAGSSIHLITNHVDFGPVLGRVFEKIKCGDTIESLYTRLKEKENKLYIEVLKKLCS